MVWVQAQAIVRIEENGKLLTLYPGDWGQMGNHQAREELRRGSIKILKPAALLAVQDLTDCTILLRGGVSEEQRSRLTAKFPGVPIGDYARIPDKGRFLLWDTAANLRQDLILTGFGLLTKWQLAVPLLNYDTLAQDVGTVEDRTETKTVIHDLRVPIYDHRVIFARQCQEVRQLFEMWQGGTELTFLRALYQARPIINALPPSWIMA